MKQIVILFVLILFATASSDLLKSISKFADEGDNSSKFAKSKVSPFSEGESEDYDNEDTGTSKKMVQQDDEDEEVDVMAQLKSYQQKLSTNKDVKPPQPQKKQIQAISESESEYDDEDDSGNMWSRGISKKLAQTESKPLILQFQNLLSHTVPIQTAKEQIKNDFNQFTSLKMPEVPQRSQESKIQDISQKVQDDSEKDHSADFEKMKQAQLEKYSKRFHLDEPKESKSMYEDDSLKEFMPKINFQPINIQETKTQQQIQQNPEKKQENKYDEQESESDEVDNSIETNKKNSSSKKNNNKVTNNLQSNSDAFDFFNQNKQQQKSNKKSEKIEQSESESDEDSMPNEMQDNEDDEEDEDYVQQVKKSKKQKEDKEEQKRKLKQLQQQQEEEEEQKRIMLKKQKEKEKQLQQEELRKKQEEEERLLELSKQQQVKRDFDDDQIPQKKKSKKQKKQLSLEEFQQSLNKDEEKSQLTAFAQKEAKEKAILEQKTFTLVKETPQQVQEQKVFKLQAVPKKQQQLIQEEESELESESENDEDFDTPKQINCFESKNKFIQQICQLCQTKVAYQVNQQNWQKIGINDGFRQSFEPLIEFTFKSIGEVGSYYLSFKDHTVCLSAENLTKITNIDKVLKHFTGNQLADYNSPVDIPAKSQPINFLLSAEYDSLLNGFSCRRFQIAIKTDLKYKLSKKNDINVKQIIFYKNKLKLKYIGLIQINGVVHQASFDQEEGGEATNLIVTQLNLPKEQGVIASLVDKYIDNNFVANLFQKSEQMMADLQIQTHIKNDDIGLTFNLRKKKGK